MANVFVTGCSSGFGELAALAFARRGDHVTATMRTPAKGERLRAAAADAAGTLVVERCDVDDAASVGEAVAGALARGPIDVLVNNAGIECRSSIEDASDADVRRQFETNVFGTLRLIRAVLPGMRARGRGAIVNVSSVAGLVARPFGGLYSASKHALEGLSEALALEVAPFGIRVALVEPGQYATRLLDNAWTGAGFGPASPYWERSERFDRAMHKVVPEGRRADPQEVADLVVRVAHDPQAPLRTLAGRDAEMIAAAHRQLSFEDYVRAMRGTLDWWD
ncbi:MAG: SDR family oxidoreductase [bacterium]|nr:SDR family oxidoreductase [bacterium]